ncbi:AAA ATPase [Candidatus Symbiothrix dinenymphae]|nr:AAA ATPase [Candidatus Symbiothrix dinenymphae]
MYFCNQIIITMEAKKYKRLPYGISDFRRIILENYAYVDKTMYIEMLENETNPNQFFIRPRKFGKSLFFMTLSYYYDLNHADEFDTLFGDLYIGKHPTPERNMYAVLKFDFSGLDTASEEGFVKSFSEKVQDTVRNFFRIYGHIFPEADKYVNQIDDDHPGIAALQKVFSAASQNNVKLFFIIDEYDHFANDLIAMGSQIGKNLYKAMVAANGIVRDFYERVKDGAKSSLVNRTFITGISPVMLDDLTSGYNIATVLTLEPQYNEMMGFTQEEAEWLMRETGVEEKYINIDMQAYYNGYLFHKDGAHRVYNPAMMLYFFEQIIRRQQPPEHIIDLNLRTDYGRLQKLTQNDSNRATLLKIVKEDSIISDILQKFSIDMLNDDDYFVSLLFYMGLLTIDKEEYGTLRLKIPNYSIKTLYWEYIARLTKANNENVLIDFSTMKIAVRELAYCGNPTLFLDYMSNNIISRLSNRDLENFDEKYLKIILLNNLFQSLLYVPITEMEVSTGYTDIWLKRSPLLPEIPWEWVWEIKYVKKSNAKSVKEARKEASAQLEKYRQSHLFAGRTDVRYLSVIFIGKDKYEMSEPRQKM